jgi:tetratricopeptide (TPR) repeat protein
MLGICGAAGRTGGGEVGGAQADEREALRQKVETLAQSGAFGEAETAARQYVNGDARSAQGHFLLGYILFREAKAKESLEEYTEGAKYAEPGAAELKVVALDYALLGDYADAEKWLTQSVQRNPKDAEGWYYLGRTQYNENLFEKAKHAFEECLALDARHVKAEANLGLALEGLRQTEEAEAAYRKAISWEEEGAPKNAEPFIDLGSLLLEQNRNADAAGVLARALEIAPDDMRGRGKLGTAYYRLGDFAKAQGQLERAAELAPNDAGIHYLLGQTYRKLGLREKAQAELARATELNGEHASPAKDGAGIVKP